MNIQSGIEERRARVEIVPLLDVLLIVLIFFVYLSLTMTSQQSIALNLPSGKGTEVAPSLTIAIHKDNAIEISGIPVTLYQAVEEVLRRAANSELSDFQVLLASDRSSSLGTSVELLSLLQQSGITHVSIEVSRK